MQRMSEQGTKLLMSIRRTRLTALSTYPCASLYYYSERSLAITQRILALTEGWGGGGGFPYEKVGDARRKFCFDSQKRY